MLNKQCRKKIASFFSDTFTIRQFSIVIACQVSPENIYPTIYHTVAIHHANPGRHVSPYECRQARIYCNVLLPFYFGRTMSERVNIGLNGVLWGRLLVFVFR